MAFRPPLIRIGLSVISKKLGRSAFASSASPYEVKLLKNIPPPPPVIAYFRPSPTIVGPPPINNWTPSILDDVVSRIGPILDVPKRHESSPITSNRQPAAIEDPTIVIEQQAARLIVIRRRKMRRHKLKKLRKRMKFEWAKVRQKRELRKEKLFQTELMSKIREAENFDPAAHVAAKLRRANEILTPKMWKGKRLPEFLIKELIEKRNEKRQLKLERQQRRQNMITNVAEYKV